MLPDHYPGGARTGAHPESPGTYRLESQREWGRGRASGSKAHDARGTDEKAGNPETRSRSVFRRREPFLITAVIRSGSHAACPERREKLYFRPMISKWR